MLHLNKITEVPQLTATVASVIKDNFIGPLEQKKLLPATFLLGESCQLAHECMHCNNKVSFKLEYGAFIIAKTWSIDEVNFNKGLLDEIGDLLNLELEGRIKNNEEIARYYRTVLGMAKVGYYKCPQCQAQYLIGYSRRMTDNEGRGMPEPDTLHVQKIAQVTLEEAELMRLLERRDMASQV